MTTQEWIDLSDRYIMSTYKRHPLVLTRGLGVHVWDSEGRCYLDLVGGIAVCALGHSHPRVVEALKRQLELLTHVSNLYHIENQIHLAQLLVENSCLDKVFFCNSGAEANEAAIKLARKASPPGKYEIISLAGSFHGRTLATVAATGQEKFHQGFEPLPQGFRHAPFGDLAALEAMIGPATCAILCEPLQGEGGVRPLAREYLAGIRHLCDKHGLLLIFDEIQVGMGRTGTLFAYEQCGVTPDILTLAKALGNGLPIGAMLARESVAKAFEPGSHASTFGGNPVVCAAAVTVLRIMLAEGFLAEVRAKGDYLNERLTGLAAKYPAIAGPARGLGLIQGLPLDEAWLDQGPAMVNRLFEKGVLLNFAGGKVLRCLPPLIISRAELDRLIQAMDEVFAELSR